MCMEVGGNVMYDIMHSRKPERGGGMTENLEWLVGQVIYYVGQKEKMLLLFLSF